MLEIQVFDEIKTADSLKEALVIIVEAFKKWLESDDKVPFKLMIKKLDNKAPPTLTISVEETIQTKSAFGK